MNTTTKAEREKHVAQMRANFAIEDMRPDADDQAMQQRYIDGTASLNDQKWPRKSEQAAKWRICYL